ncbi:unnamed protein product [Rotaria sp. Silwood1]|nr:unnamed protein product [Rotaria sp. Silwood1]
MIKPPKVSHRQGSKVMISYCSCQYDLAQKLVKGLIARRIPVVCPSMNIHEMIKIATQEARVVLPLMSEAYEASQTAKYLMSYVDEAGIPIIPIKTQANYSQSGWLGVICAAALFIKMTNTDNFEQKLNSLAEQLHPYISDSRGEDQKVETLVDETLAQGYYIQNGEKFDMTFDLFVMTNGYIAGEGNDEIGSFVINGKYTRLSGTEDLEFQFKKHYIGRHTVQKGNINTAMATGVEGAALIISFDTVAYSKSINCQKEFTYALQLKKNIVPVLLEHANNLQNTWLGNSIASLNTINMQDESQFDSSFKALLQRINIALKEKEVEDSDRSQVITRFEGGIVTGKYCQYGQDFDMVFDFFSLREGRVSGQGNDTIAPFTMAGYYDNEGKVCFTKQYVGKHAVIYKGNLTCDNLGGFKIEGKWNIGDLTDYFCLESVSTGKANIWLEITLMNIKPTRSTTVFTHTTIDSLLLPSKKEKQQLLMMSNSEQINIDSTLTTLDLHKNVKTITESTTSTLGHDLDDQRPAENDQNQQSLMQQRLNSIQKFDRHRNPKIWLKHIIEKFDLLQLSSLERNELISEILTGDALIWHSAGYYGATTLAKGYA